MQYIDDRVIYTFSYTASEPSIIRYDVVTDGEVIFNGNMYVDGQVTIDITEIIKNFVDTNKPPFDRTLIENDDIVKEVCCRIYINNVVEETQCDTIFMGYRQPNYKSYVTTPLIDITAVGYGVQPMLQGFKGLSGYFLPTYPTNPSETFTIDILCSYEKIPLIQQYLRVHYPTTYVEIGYGVLSGGTGYYQRSLSLEEVVTGATDNVSGIVYLPCDAKRIELINVIPPMNRVYGITIAKFDNNSRYFLKWKDRYGMPQVQPFAGTFIFSESITTKEIANYYNKRRVINYDIKPKWNLNTKWIKETDMPFYESLFVSPYVQLYDSKEDKIYDVIVTDKEFTEKTFKNQGNSLFNIQLNVELDTTQNIVY